jgi:arsenite methyltransferase
MSTPFDRLLERMASAFRAHADAALERHVLDVARITPGEIVVVVGERPALAAHVFTAEHLERDSESVDVVLSVNHVQLWRDRTAGFTELYRVLRPGGRLVLSAYEKWLPVPRHELAAEVEAAGFTDLQTWLWEPPGLGAAPAAQLRARRPG